MRNARTDDEKLEIEAAPAPNDADLKRIAGAARQVVELENDIAKLEEQLQAKKGVLKQLQESALPEAMAAAGIMSFNLAKGWAVGVKNILSASIPKGAKGGEDLRPQAFAMLEQQGAGSLIKHTITIEFGKGEEAWAKKFLRDCAQRKRPLNAVREDTVHPQTLGHYARERRDSGMLTDDDRRLFGVFEVNRAVVTRPQAAKEGL